MLPFFVRENAIMLEFYNLDYKLVSILYLNKGEFIWQIIYLGPME